MKKITIVLWVIISIFVIGVVAKTNNLFKPVINDKQISFLGDSITTYEGWNNNTDYNTTIGSNAVYYTSSKLDDVNKTYWKQTVDELDLNLCVNNSWSGSRVTTTSGETAAGCMKRTENLHNDNEKINPDIIVVYIGINDFNANVTLGNYKDVSDFYDEKTKKYTGDTTIFSEAYAMMIHNIINNYKDAKVYICTLLPNGTNTNYTLLKEYNAMIRKIANEFKCGIIDFYNDSKITSDNYTTYMIDGLHPNEKGHDMMTTCVNDVLLKDYRLKEKNN